jgi:hypothetical protein
MVLGKFYRILTSKLLGERLSIAQTTQHGKLSDIAYLKRPPVLTIYNCGALGSFLKQN